MVIAPAAAACRAASLSCWLVSAETTGLVAVEAVAVVVEQQVQASAGAYVYQSQRSRPPVLAMIEAEPKGDAAADVVGLGGPLPQETDQLVAMQVVQLVVAHGPVTESLVHPEPATALRRGTEAIHNTSDNLVRAAGRYAETEHTITGVLSGFMPEEK